MPYVPPMQTVLLTRTFERQAADEGLDDDDLAEIIFTIAWDPLSGDLMPGTGGARKLRHPGRGKGKSGGYRTIHYFGGGDVPVFLLAVYGKGGKANLTAAEKNELARALPKIANEYRAAQRRRT